MRAILGGEKGARRDMVLINAGAALMAAGVAADLQAGVDKAAEIIDSGKALAKLDELVAFCQALQ
jgi:anthranilate phosphoribosyltransferase